jgi:hypothetical protein
MRHCDGALSLRPRDCRAALQAVVDLLEPPLPAKVNAEQAMHFAEARSSSQAKWHMANRGKIALTAFSETKYGS